MKYHQEKIFTDERSTNMELKSHCLRDCSSNQKGPATDRRQFIILAMLTMKFYILITNLSNCQHNELYYIMKKTLLVTSICILTTANVTHNLNNSLI